jgi:hypothetical protein
LLPEVREIVCAEIRIKRGPWQFLLLARVAAEHESVVEEDGCEGKPAGGRDENSLSRRQAICPKVEDEHSGEVVSIVDAMEPRTGEYFIGALFAVAAESAGSEITARSGGCKTRTWFGETERF